MFKDLTVLDAIKMFAPLLIVELALYTYCIINILKKGVRNLNKPLWIVIVLLINMFGAIAYLAVGRRRWEDDQDK